MNPLHDKRVLVTGAGGFIASHLVETLVPLCRRVTAMLHYDSRADWGNLEHLPGEIRSNLDVIAGDVADPGFVLRAVKDHDFVFHLAALISIPYSYQAPHAFFQTNTLGTVNVLESCRTQGVERLVAISTSECYGSAQFVPIHENHPLQPQSPYSASKIAADQAVLSFHHTYRLPAVVIRPFNTFGPRQSARAIIPTIITQILSDAPTLRLGSLTPLRDFTFVSDTVAGIIAGAGADNVEGETINLGFGKGIPIGELAQKIMTLAGLQKPLESDSDRIRPEGSEVLALISDRSKAGRLLNWEPVISLEDGLQKTIDFIRLHPHLYKAGHYTL